MVSTAAVEFLATSSTLTSGGWWFTLFTAILGAVILLGLLRLVRRA